MNECKRKAYLYVIGSDALYPTYKGGVVKLITEEVLNSNTYKNHLSSPIFTLNKEGINTLPTFASKTTIVFFIVPELYPNLHILNSKAKFKGKLWFSIGLVNLILIDEDNDLSLIEEIVKTCNCQNHEKWEVENEKIQNWLSNINDSTAKASYNTYISNALPSDLRFIISEYNSLSNEIKNDANKFLPHYSDHFERIFAAGNLLVADLQYLHGDNSHTASDYLLNKLNEKNRDSLINDRLGRLVQFTSALTYIHTQTYSGKLPILYNKGQIKRYSLLGVGCAVNALFELVTQLEEAFQIIDLKKLFDESYNNDAYLITEDILHCDLSLHKKEHWEDANGRQVIINRNSPKGYISGGKDYFGRFAFFSARLGFREYDFSATAALQVLGNSKTLKWNIINYTHEIIHNHVRILLRYMLNGNLNNIKESIESDLKVIEKNMKGNLTEKIRFTDFFRRTLLVYCINNEYYGGLSRSWSKEKFLGYKEEKSFAEYRLPNATELFLEFSSSFKDISEIFVHVIDFSYIYLREIEVYIKSIWSSWVTVSSVTSNLSHYIVRSLIVIGILEKGDSSSRFDSSLFKFKKIIKDLIKNEQNDAFKKIDHLLDKKEEFVNDLRYRFYNSITIADLADLFFCMKLETFLNKNDENIIIPASSSDILETGVYQLKAGALNANHIKSKVRFVLDQLIDSINNNTLDIGDDSADWDSHWLLISLSSHHD